MTGQGPAPSRQVEALKMHLLAGSPPARAPRLKKQWEDTMSEIRAKRGEDVRFIRSWLHAKYAVWKEIRSGRPTEDYKGIEAGVAIWVRNNHEKMGLHGSGDYARLLKSAMFYGRLYVRIRDAVSSLVPGMEHVYYIKKLRVPEKFYYPALMSAVLVSDEPDIVMRKVDMAARFLEAFYVLMKMNCKSTSDSVIGPYVFMVVHYMRDKDPAGLASALRSRSGRIEEWREKWLEGLMDVRLRATNKWFVHYLLARITSHVEVMSGRGNRFEEYAREGCEDCHTIEHLLPSNSKPGPCGFADRAELSEWRNKLGALVLLPGGVNRSLRNLPYADKAAAYRVHNLLAGSLDEGCYRDNPLFAAYNNESGHPFRFYRQFGKEDIAERHGLYARLCREIWDPARFGAGSLDDP
ncbi:MAG: HNH endonuclease family protein [Alphaproteobacteria bacterium]|nr:HNH endonuclease family protein [Alphaproteobacteria bacterium]